MTIVKYQSGDTLLLKRLCKGLPPYHSLRYPSFVDYYYTNNDWADLSLLVEDDTNVILGVLGLERMKFSVSGRELLLGSGSGFFSFQSGAGRVLFADWMRRCDFGLVFGGSSDMHRIIKRHKWLWTTSVGLYRANRSWESSPGESRWKRLAKAVLRRLQPKANLADRAHKMACDGPNPVEAIEEGMFHADMLPRTSPYTLRFSPDVDHLKWRYNPELTFVRYRLFRITCDNETQGYVVINEQADRLIVAQCDATDSLVLVQGVCAALSHVDRGKARREWLLSSSDPVMQNAVQHIGFRATTPRRPLAIGSLGEPLRIEDDTDRWLINFDWGDNGLRPPFLGQPKLDVQT